MLDIDASQMGQLYQFHQSMYTYPPEGSRNMLEDERREAWTYAGEVVTVIDGIQSLRPPPFGDHHKDHIDYYVIHRPLVGVRLAEISCFLKCAKRL